MPPPRASPHPQKRPETKVHVAAVHPGSKASNGTTPRGHSCLTGADDALIEVTKHDDGARSARVVHATDDADGDTFSFRLDRVDLGEDEDGDPITTPIVEETHAADAANATRQRVTGNEATALRMLDSALLHHPQRVFTDDGTERHAVHIERWRECFYRDGKPGVSKDTQKKAFQRVCDSLLNKQRIASRDGFIWRPDTG